MTTLLDQATLSLTEAAEALGLAPQTVRRRIKRGEIPGRLENGPRGLEYRIPTAAVQHVAHDQASQTTQPYSAADQGYQARGQARIIKTSRGLSPHAAGGFSGNSPINDRSSGHNSHHAELIEQQRDQALSEVQFLRQQLQAREDARREELGRIDQERAEMRRLLLTSQQLAHELAQQLEVKALPAHNDVQPPKRIRWWWWKR